MISPLILSVIERNVLLTQFKVAADWLVFSWCKGLGWRRLRCSSLVHNWQTESKMP